MGNLFSANNDIVKYESLVMEYKNQIEELKKQNKALMKLNKDLRKEISQQVSDSSSSQIPVNQPVSMDIVREYVAKMLEKEECNIEYIPDFVERRLYEKMFGMILTLMEHTLESTSVKFMGHQIRFYVTK
jgi:hypothetical protein